MISIDKASIGFDTGLFRVDHIDLQKGKVHAIMGKNGIGKTALLKTLSGLVNPLTGSLLIENKDMSGYKRRELSQKVSFVSAKPLGIPFLTVDAYLLLGRSNYTNIFGQYSEDDRSQIAHAKEKFKIAHLGNKYTDELSSGELQLCAIAKAYVQGTDFIILDEPTSHLDYSNKRKVYDLLTDMAANENKGIVISTHDIDMVFKFSFEYYLVDSKEGELKQLSSRESIDLEFEN